MSELRLPKLLPALQVYQRNSFMTKKSRGPCNVSEFLMVHLISLGLRSPKRRDTGDRSRGTSYFPSPVSDLIVLTILSSLLNATKFETVLPSFSGTTDMFSRGLPSHKKTTTATVLRLISQNPELHHLRKVGIFFVCLK